VSVPLRVVRSHRHACPHLAKRQQESITVPTTSDAEDVTVSSPACRDANVIDSSARIRPFASSSDASVDDSQRAATMRLHLIDAVPSDARAGTVLIIER